MIIPQNVKLRRNPPSYEIVCSRLIELKKPLQNVVKPNKALLWLGYSYRLLLRPPDPTYSYCTILAVSVQQGVLGELCKCGCTSKPRQNFTVTHYLIRLENNGLWFAFHLAPHNTPYWNIFNSDVYQLPSSFFFSEK